MTSISLATLPAKLQTARGKQWTLNEPALMTGFVSPSQEVSFEALSNFRRGQTIDYKHTNLFTKYAGQKF